MTMPPAPAHKLEENAAWRWRKPHILLVIVLVATLFVFNVLTLVNDRFHAAGFNALKALLSSSLPEATLSRALSRSPTRNYQSLAKANKELEAQHIELRRSSMVRAEVSKRISTRVARRAVVNAGKNASSVALEVVPFAGTAAILALTASDLYDDCQTLKDMNELNVAFGQEKHDEATVCGLRMPFF